MTHPDALLEVSNLAYSYNGLAAVRDVSFHVGSGEVVALLGGNGAGKSTTVKVVAGALKAKVGTIRFDGEAIEGQPSHVVVKRGITLVPEGRLVFPLMTVEENLQMGGFTQPAASVARAIEHSFTLFPRLAERRAQRAVPARSCWATTMCGGPSSADRSG
jgi:branched-chain amino acid transport system ATP-binding protein